MAQRLFHGLDPITPELKESIYSWTTCLMWQELCGVRADDYGPPDITVAMREQITAERVRLTLIATYTKDCSNTMIPGLKQGPNTVIPAAGLGLESSLRDTRQSCCSPVARPIKQAAAPASWLWPS